jgi:hypothetical protein
VTKQSRSDLCLGVSATSYLRFQVGTHLLCVYIQNGEAIRFEAEGGLSCTSSGKNQGA